DAVGQPGCEHARDAVDGAARGPGDDGAHGLALSEGRLIHENGNEEQRKPESPHAASFVMSFAMREASLSFSRSSTASRSRAIRARGSAYAASVSNFSTTCASLAKFGSLPRGVSTLRSRMIPSASWTSTRTAWRYLDPFAVIAGSATTSTFSASAMRLR